MRNLILVLKGGRGSGDFGHVGRAGKRGGSGGGGGKGKPRKGRRSREALDKEIEVGKKPKKPVFSNGKITNDTIDREEDVNIRKIDKNFENNRSFMRTPNAGVIDNLSKKTGVDKIVVERYLKDWNAGDNSVRYGISKSVQRVLGVSTSKYEKGKTGKWEADIISQNRAPGQEADYDKITRAIYDDTQKQLKDLGSSRVLLYRGMMDKKSGRSKGDKLTWDGNAIDSWTTNLSIANEFTSEYGGPSGGFVIKSSIPADRIFSLSSSGAGTSNEFEMVVLGNGPNDEVVVAKVTE